MLLRATALLLAAFSLGLLGTAVCVRTGHAQTQSAVIETRRQELVDVWQQWKSTYPVALDCVLTVASRETGGTFDHEAYNPAGPYSGDFQFGPGESTIWRLSRDWVEEHKEPWQVSWQERERVFMALQIQYPVESRGAWVPLPASCSS